MTIYLHSDNAERSPRYVVTVAPAGDEKFVSSEDAAKWRNADGSPKQIEVIFAYGKAEESSDLERYMVDRGIAKRHRMLRKVRQLFDQFGKPIEAVFDKVGNRIFLEGQDA
jgi:hypothetical protein